MMNILLGTALLLVVLALFTLFSYKAPQGMKAMGGLASAACASFLVCLLYTSSYYYRIVNIIYIYVISLCNIFYYIIKLTHNRSVKLFKPVRVF